jgi:oxygen-independent coproporphyrinogen-3 oxidase
MAAFLGQGIVKLRANKARSLDVIFYAWFLMANHLSVPPPDPSQGTYDATRALGIYVHVPFCKTRCPYCDFATVAEDAIAHEVYIHALMHELAFRAAWFGAPHTPLTSLYFGGGTPGLLQPEHLSQVIDKVRGLFPTNSKLEITVEANPGDFSDPDGFMASGVNRLSFGAQAFQNHLLTAIGRRHRVNDIHAAFNAARKAGFQNLCADLMFGLPGQTMTDWKESLSALTQLGPEHITTYALTIEPGTVFGGLERKGKLLRPDDEIVADMYTYCHDWLTQAGYEHYEISSYAKPGCRSQHNSLYWRGGAYLGVGASAASFRPCVDGSGWRFSNPRSLGTYMQTAHMGQFQSAQIEKRSADSVEDEMLWLALRTTDGIDRVAHTAQYGVDPLTVAGRASAAMDCMKAGWLEITPERIGLTAAGFLFADEVAVRLSREE